MQANLDKFQSVSVESKIYASLKVTSVLRN